MNDGRIPNNPERPLLVYARALSRCRELLAPSGSGGAWVDRVSQETQSLGLQVRAMPGREPELEVALARRLRAHALLAELRAKGHLGSS